VGKTYDLELHRPKEDKVPYICKLTFSAPGDDFGDIVQVSRRIIRDIQLSGIRRLDIQLWKASDDLFINYQLSIIMNYQSASWKFAINYAPLNRTLIKVRINEVNESDEENAENKMDLCSKLNSRYLNFYRISRKPWVQQINSRQIFLAQAAARAPLGNAF